MLRRFFMFFKGQIFIASHHSLSSHLLLPLSFRCPLRSLLVSCSSCCVLCCRLRCRCLSVSSFVSPCFFCVFGSCFLFILGSGHWGLCLSLSLLSLLSAVCLFSFLPIFVILRRHFYQRVKRGYWVNWLRVKSGFAHRHNMTMPLFRMN